jgi:hypothetical protein
MTGPALAELAEDGLLMGRPRICAKIGMRGLHVNQNLLWDFNGLEISTDSS